MDSLAVSVAPVEPPEFDPSRMPHAVILLAQGCEDPSELEEALELEDGVPELSRRELRQLLSYAANERNLDRTATAPTATEVLDLKITSQLNKEIDRIMDENKILTSISGKDRSKKFQLSATGEVISPDEARGRVRANISSLLEIKKALTEHAKAQASKNDAGVNVNVDLSGLITSTLSNIKESESYIDMQ